MLLGGKTVHADSLVVGALLDELAERGGEAVTTAFFGAVGQAPVEDLRVLVNGRSVAFLDGFETRLRADDTVTLHITGARGFPGG